MAYYRNPGMLAEHYRTWAAYPDALKAQIEIVLCDDGSPVGEQANEVARPLGLPRLRIYRLTVDKPWNQDAARNRAAHEARGEWLLLTDMDHVVELLALVRMLDLHLTADQPANRVFLFDRVDAPDHRPTVDGAGRRKPHMNSFAMRRAHYWAVGGYDEAYSGEAIHCTDGLFRRRLDPVSDLALLGDVALLRYPREFLADADTRGLERKPAWRGEARLRIAREKAEAGRAHIVDVLTEPWERQL